MTKFREMWNHQRQLMEKMESIESDNGLLEFAGPIRDINEPRDQAKLRRYAWQVVEEIAEVMESTPETRLEEIADVLHFLVEMLIVAGIELDGGPFDLLEIAFRKPGLGSTRSFAWGNLVNQLGITINGLKNRPWKLVHRETDEEKFKKGLMDILFEYFVSAVQVEGYSVEDLYAAYFQKNQTNHKRCEEVVDEERPE